MVTKPSLLRLFGRFQLIAHGDEKNLVQSRLEELIALVAVNAGEPLSRSQVAFQLWPDSNERQARANVRNLLYKLKQTWPDMGDAINVTRTHVAWREESDIFIDVHQFDLLRVSANRQNRVDDSIAALTEAADLYHGDFLPNCFADWALTERERLRGEYATTLEQLIDLLLEERRYEEALSQATTLQRFDPLRESAYRYLMQTHTALGDRAASLRVYHTCASTLQQELGVEPSPATEALRKRLLHLEEETALSGAPATVERQQLVGRREEWRMLQDVWRRVQAREAHCVLLWGEAGIGKTRLAEELIDWVQRQGGTCASSRSYAVQGALTYAPIAEWLRSPGVRPSLEGIDDLWRVELARLLPGLLVDRPDLPPPGSMTENWQQQRFFQSVVHALQAAPGPLLLHLDDMQWCDAETLTLLQFLLHGASRHPLLLIGGIRTEDAGNNQALASFVEATRHARQLADLRLGPLSAQETAELADLTSGEEIDQDELESLYASSEGHPLFLVEAVRSGLSVLPTRTDAPPSRPSEIEGVAAMPPRIYNLLAARLSQLSKTAQQVVSMAAVIGRAFDYKIVQNAVSLDEMTLIDALDELWRLRIIREQAGEGYDFSHDRIREVAYQEISRARRRLFHRQVTRALESVHSDNLDDIAGELAAHCAQAGDSEEAYRYYRRAAEVALAQHALPHAEVMLDAALGHISDDPMRRLEVLQYQDHVFGRSLQFERWKANLDEEEALLASMESADLHLSLTHKLSRSRYFSTLVEGSEAVAAAQTAIKIAQRLEDKSALAHGYHELGNGYWVQSRLVDATQAYGRSAQFARETGELVLECGSLQLQAEPGMFSGMPADKIYDLLSRALAIAESIDNKQDLPDILGKFAYWRVTRGIGDFDQAEQEYQRALQVAQEIGHRLHEEMVLSNLGVLFAHKGDYRQAMKALKAAIDMGQGDSRFWRYWVAHHYRGAAWMEMGCLDAAYDNLVVASEQLHQLGNRHYEVKARCDLGLVHHLAGRNQRAEEGLTHVLGLIEGHGDLRFQALVNTRLGYVFELNREIVSARHRYRRGYDLHNQMEQRFYAMNAKAGLARIAAAEGDGGDALDHAVTIWETIGGKEMDATIETARTLRTCYTIFDAHDDPRADAVLSFAWDQLQLRVVTIDDPAHVEQFWQIEDHHFFRMLVECD